MAFLSGLAVGLFALGIFYWYERKFNKQYRKYRQDNWENFRYSFEGNVEDQERP